MYPSSFFAGKEKSKIDAKRESRNISCNGSKTIESNNSITKEPVDHNKNNNRWSNNIAKANDNVICDVEGKHAICNENYNSNCSNNSSKGIGNITENENVAMVESGIASGSANSANLYSPLVAQEHVGSLYTPVSVLPPHTISQTAGQEMKLNGYVNTDYSVPLHMQQYNNESSSPVQTSHLPHAPPPLVNLNTRLAKDRATIEPQQHHSNINNSYQIINNSSNYISNNNTCPPYDSNYGIISSTNNNNNAFYSHNNINGGGSGGHNNIINTNFVSGQWPQLMTKPESNIPFDNNINSTNTTSWSHAQHPSSYLQDTYSYSHTLAHNNNYINNNTRVAGNATTNINNRNSFYNNNSNNSITIQGLNSGSNLVIGSSTSNDYNEKCTTFAPVEQMQQRWSEPLTSITQSRETENIVNVGYETHPLSLKSSTSIINTTATHSSSLSHDKLMSPSKKLLTSLTSLNEPQQPLVLSRQTALPVNVANTTTSTSKNDPIFSLSSNAQSTTCQQELIASSSSSSLTKSDLNPISSSPVNASSDVQKEIRKLVSSPLSSSDTAMCNRIDKEPYEQKQHLTSEACTTKIKENECDVMDHSASVERIELENSNINVHTSDKSEHTHEIVETSKSDCSHAMDTLEESNKLNKDANIVNQNFISSNNKSNSNYNSENSKTSISNSNDKTKPVAAPPKRSAMYPSYFFHAEKRQQNTQLTSSSSASASASESSSSANNQTTTTTSTHQLQTKVEEKQSPNVSRTVSHKPTNLQPVELSICSDEHATITHNDVNNTESTHKNEKFNDNGCKNAQTTPIYSSNNNLEQMESIKSVEHDKNKNSNAKSTHGDLHTKTDSNLPATQPSYYYRHNNNNNINNIATTTTTISSSGSCSDKELSIVNANESNEQNEQCVARIGFHARSASTPLSTPPTTFQSAKSFSSYVQSSPMHERNMTNISTCSNTNNNNYSNYNMNNAQESYTPPQEEQPPQQYIQPYYAQQNNYSYMQPYQQPYSFSEQQQQQQPMQPNMMMQPSYNNVNVAMYGGNAAVQSLPPLPPPPLPPPQQQQQQQQQQSTFYSANQLLPPMVPTLPPQVYFSPTSQNQTNTLTSSPAHSYASSSAAHVRSVAESFPPSTTFSRELMTNNNNNNNNNTNVANQTYTGTVFDMNNNGRSNNNYTDINALNANQLVEANMTPLATMNTSISPLFGAKNFVANNYSVNNTNNNYINGFMTSVPYFLQTSASPPSTLALPFQQFTNILANHEDTRHTSNLSGNYSANSIVPQIIYEHCPNSEEVWMEEMDSQRKFTAETFGNIVSLLDAFAPRVQVMETLEIPCWNAAYYTYGCVEEDSKEELTTSEHLTEMKSTHINSKTSDNEENNSRQTGGNVDNRINNIELTDRDTNNYTEAKLEISDNSESCKESEYEEESENGMVDSDIVIKGKTITLEHVEDLAEEAEAGTRRKSSSINTTTDNNNTNEDKHRDNELVSEEEYYEEERYVDFSGPSVLEPIVKLEDIWRSFDEPFGYTISLAHPIQLTETRIKEESVTYVPMLSGFRIQFHSHSLPYKHLVELSINESECNSSVSSHGLLTWSASERPDNRNNLVEQVAELVHSHVCFEPLLSATTADVDHQSWIALLWQPVFCGTHSAKNTCGSFLVYYLLRPPRQLFAPYVAQSEWARVNGDVQSCVFRADRAAVACDLWSFSRKYHVARIVDNNNTTTNNKSKRKQSIRCDCKKNRNSVNDEVGEEPHTTHKLTKDHVEQSELPSSQACSTVNEKDVVLPEHDTVAEPASPNIIPCKGKECNKTCGSHNTHSQESQESCNTNNINNSTKSKKTSVKQKIRIPIVGLLPNRCRADVWFEPQYLPPPSANYTNTIGRHPFFENSGVNSNNNNNINNNLYQIRNNTATMYDNNNTVTTTNNTNSNIVSTSPHKAKRLASSWCYRAPLFLIASALQLMSWNAYMENKRINKYKSTNKELPSSVANDSKNASNIINNKYLAKENGYVNYYEEGVTLLVEAARRYRALREAALIDTIVSSSPLSASLLLLTKVKSPVNESNTQKKRRKSSRSVVSEETEHSLENSLTQSHSTSTKNEKAPRSCNEELKSNEVEETNVIVRSTEKTITRMEPTKSTECTIIAGGTNSLLCKQHASVILGLLDFYQWMQYDAALVQFAEKY